MDYSEKDLIKYVKFATEEFYELVYNDPWFKKIFRNIDQKIITSQQIDFMVGALGGPRRFCGRAPGVAHPHIWVDEDIWNYREVLLKQAFDHVCTPKDIQEKWLKIDEAFKNGIINKGGKEECEKRYTNDEIIYEPMPKSLKKSA